MTYSQFIIFLQCFFLENILNWARITICNQLSGWAYVGLITFNNIRNILLIALFIQINAILIHKSAVAYCCGNPITPLDALSKQ